MRLPTMQLQSRIVLRMTGSLRASFVPPGVRGSNRKGALCGKHGRRCRSGTQSLIRGPDGRQGPPICRLPLHMPTVVEDSAPPPHLDLSLHHQQAGATLRAHAPPCGMQATVTPCVSGVRRVENAPEFLACLLGHSYS